MDFSDLRESLPEVGELPKKVCAVCLAPAEKSCGACHGVYYCSVEHQKSHWKEHKKDCPPIKIVNTPEIGPHFVATRDLPPWSLLHTELPVLVSPFVISKDYLGIGTCISCRSILSSNLWPCSQCSTPFFCNLSCSMNKIHSDFECGVLKKCNTNFEQITTFCCHPNLGYLRAIHLKDKDPETWIKILDMHGANQYKPGYTDENDKSFIREILPLVGEKGVGFEADIAKLRGIFQQKRIVVRSSGNLPKKDHGKTHFLYLKASNFVQNCFSNCTRIIGKSPSFQLQVRTTVVVKKGEIPSIDYQGISRGIGVMVKQHMIHENGGALCICPSCTDPTGTELGTMQSAVKCTQRKCKDGYLLPVNVRDMAMNAPWRCNRSGCKGKGSTWSEIKMMSQKLEDDMKVFLASVPLGDEERTVEFLATLKKKLHPNHWNILEFEGDLARELYSQMMERGVKFSLARMDLHISMIEHLITMTDLIDPGLNFARGYFLSLLYNGLNHRLLWDPLIHHPGAVQKRLMERTIEVIDIFLPIAKLFPDNWIPTDIQNLIEKRRMLQMALN